MFSNTYKCTHCGEVQGKLVCRGCAPAHLLLIGQSNARYARSHGITEFYATCEEHGFTMFSSKEARCKLCMRTPRAAAREAGLPNYDAQCWVHGVTAHGVQSGRCLTCYAAAGRPRLRATANVNGPRARARRAESDTYQDVCETHGLTGHWTSVGQCQTCFSAAGKPRQRPGVPLTVTPARADARRTGRVSYDALCARHGNTAHGVNSGRCLTCCNSQGYPRPGFREG